MKETEKVTPSKTLKIKIEENEYEIKFPDTGKFMQIESLKEAYGGSIKPVTTSSYHARVLADAVATFEVLIPNLSSDLNVKNIFEADLLFTKKLVKVYTQVYIPWYELWMAIITDIESEE